MNKPHDLDQIITSLHTDVKNIFLKIMKLLLFPCYIYPKHTYFPQYFVFKTSSIFLHSSCYRPI